MKAKRLLLTILCMLATSSVWSAPLNYNVDRIIGTGSVSGSITTDGTFGVLSTGNVTG